LFFQLAVVHPGVVRMMVGRYVLHGRARQRDRYAARRV